MTPASPYFRTTWFFKLVECLLTAIAVLSTMMISLELLPRTFWEKNGDIFEYILIGTVAIALLVSLVYSWFWHRREATGTFDSGLRHAWLQGIIRYWLALSISTYGFAKILKTQFQTPGSRLDMPLGEVNGFGLTWYYFGYSYTLAVIIALFQIGGSILLLYRRTTLLGAIILLPVMVNIVLINLFYSIAPGAFFNSVIFTLALTFLLLLDVPRLKAAFWDLVDHLPPVRLGGNWLKHGLRLLPIVAAFALIDYFVLTDKSDKALKGTWKVEKMTRNGQVVPATAWLSDTTAWTNVYFSGWEGCAFSPNPYRYKPGESLRGSYEFDSVKNTLQVITYGEKKDTVRAVIRDRKAKSMSLSGIFRGDTLAMQLSRLR
ncbi:hypothetical protein [uncultured Fibrella sp.]|uniref:hypothetical protein n=1 Tax=uncultured Fibrella sp. TaxID=1284596 RepID=UPI0035CC475C